MHTNIVNYNHLCAAGLPKADSSGSASNAAEADPVDSGAEDAEPQPEAELNRSNGASSESLATASHAAETEPGQPSGGDDEAEEVEQGEGGNSAVEIGGEQPNVEQITAAASTSGKVRHLDFISAMSGVPLPWQRANWPLQARKKKLLARTCLILVRLVLE